jgi:hypothetical protein
MKVEYFADGSEDCPLVLLYGADPRDAAALSEALSGLTQSAEARVAIHELQGFSSVAGCQLFASVARSDVGMKKVLAPNVFDCSLRVETWENVIELLEPFCQPEAEVPNRFQYLDEHGEIRWLISSERAW